jgi:hypothetical protein
LDGRSDYQALSIQVRDRWAGFFCVHDQARFTGNP